jgi:hypothetical protein
LNLLKPNEVRFENVTDINYTYSYVAVYGDDYSEPFMEIGLTDDKDLFYLILPDSLFIQISGPQWNRIFEVGRAFQLEAIATEENFRSNYPNDPPADKAWPSR